MNNRIAQANGRLKSAKVGVVIQQIGDRLYLRATYPPKPNSVQQQPYQQRLALGCHANPAGVSFAEREARKIGALLDCKQFDWAGYLNNTPKPLTVADWVAKMEQDYFERRERNPKSEQTWQGDYLKVLKKLPMEQILTPEMMVKAIIGTRPDTKTRKRCVMVFQALANLAGLEQDFSRLAGSYSPRRVTPRDLPDDCTIANWYYKIKNPAWQWVYGMLATYGLRPHEVFRVDLADLPIVTVLEGKTDRRRVWPCFPDWVAEFNLADRSLPNVDLSRNNSQLGHTISRQFWEWKLPFTAYDLRHCWAIRTLEFGLDVSLAAQQMGHSAQVHSDLYHHWISDRHHQRAFDLLMARADRPQPPQVFGPIASDA